MTARRLAPLTALTTLTRRPRVGAVAPTTRQQAPPGVPGRLRLIDNAVYSAGRRVATPDTAELIVEVLSNTSPAATRDGSPSRAKYVVDAGLADKTRAAAAELVAAHPLYPGLELS